MKDYRNLIRALRQDGGSLASSAADAVEELIQLHQLDLGELVRLRRQYQALLEEREAAHA